MQITTSELSLKVNKGNFFEIHDFNDNLVRQSLDASFYAETNVDYHEHPDYNGPFCIITAPGATGKSALCEYISATRCAHIWNLANATLGDNYLLGTLAKTHGAGNLPKILEEIGQGEYTLVIDALDEAEISSGWYNIEKLIVSLNAHFPKIKNTVVLIARNETANLIKLILESKVGEASYSTGSIEYFTRKQLTCFCALCYKKYKNADIPQRTAEIIDTVIDEVIEAYKSAGKITNSDEIIRFIGYAPVLQAIVRFVCDFNNPQEIISKQQSSGRCIDIIKKILDNLLLREREKFLEQFRKAAEKIPNNYTEWDILFSPLEQIERLIALVSRRKPASDFIIKNHLPASLGETYERAVDVFIHQSPFLLETSFAGPAFHEYCIVMILLSKPVSDRKNYLTAEHRVYSPLLWEFYRNETTIIDGSIIGFLIDSIVAGQKKDEIITFEIGDDSENVPELCVSISYGESGPSAYKIQLYDDGIHLNRFISHVYCTTSHDVVLGFDGVLDVCDALVNCNNLTINASVININQYNAEEVSNLIAKNCNINSSVPIRVQKNGDGIFSICWPGGTNYPWTEYYEQLEESGSLKDYENWAQQLKSILKWFKKDKRQQFGKIKSMIDNIIVGKNIEKKRLLNYLKAKKIITEVSGSNMYYFSTGKLNNAGIKYIDLLRNEVKCIEKAYKEYQKSSVGQ